MLTQKPKPKPKDSIFEEEYLPSNYDVAKSWYQKKAEQGQVKAQNHLGWMYGNGYGVAQDNVLSAQWYAKAAAQNDAKGQYHLGFMFEQGLGVLKDYVTAIEYYKKAADQGYVEARFRLGFLYEQGLGVPKNYGIAVAHYREAADAGFTEAQYCMGFMYEHGYGVVKDYRLAINYYKEAMEQEHSKALYRVALMYEQGYGVVTKDLETAVDFYQKSANLGESQAQYRLGMMYEQGLGVDKNNRLARFWYKKAADQNNLDAKDKLKMSILMHEFTCERHINGRNQLPASHGVHTIPLEENYLSVTIIIKYEGMINIGNKIIVSKDIDNPYNEIYHQVMKASNETTDINCSCLECLYISIQTFSSIFTRTKEEKLDLIRTKCEQFWQQQEQELLQQADHIVEQIIQKQYNLILFGQQQEDLVCNSCSVDSSYSSDISDCAVSAGINVPKVNIN